ncbi:MAG: hypothetical protein ROZ09_01515 [Thiobacillus sp.]|nr:hypothetical protein [Thiobacillus sp.]MDT3705472.1 hypothetical protein [Thiobacillus sp.]
MFILLKCGEKINKAKTTMTKPTMCDQMLDSECKDLIGAMEAIAR